MSDLPEINFKAKDKKKGFLPWLRSRLGFGGRSAMGGAGEAAPGAANFGRAAFGGAKLGAASSAGVGGLLASKAGILAALVVSAALGTALYMKNQPEPGVSTAAFSSNKVPDEYVPAALRQKQDPGSSLEMFKETNKGAVGMEEAAPKEEAKDSSTDQPAADQEKATAEANTAEPAPENMAKEMVGKLAGGNFGGGLSTTMGGSSKFSGMGGIGNKFNSGAIGANSPGLSNLGSGFQSSSKFDQRKKLLAMRGSSRPLFSKAKGAKGSFGKGSYAQAKGLKGMQKLYSGKEIDPMAHTQNQAWTGSTGDGNAAGGAGVGDGDGGAGIVTSPSMDNTAGGGGSGGNTSDPVITNPPSPTDVSPWKGLPEKAMMYIMLAAMLSVLGAYLINMAKNPTMTWLEPVGKAICMVAMGVAAMAVMIGVKILGMGQSMLGAIYTIGGGVAIMGALKAMRAEPKDAISTKVLWMAGIAGILAMLGSMMGGK